MRYFINVFLAFTLSILILIMIFQKKDENIQFIETGDIYKSEVFDSMQQKINYLQENLYACQKDLHLCKESVHILKLH